MEKNTKTYKTRECKNCGKVFPLTVYRSYPKFCCDECRQTYNEKARRIHNLLYANAATKIINENSIEGVDYVECPICHEKHI